MKDELRVADSAALAATAPNGNAEALVRSAARHAVLGLLRGALVPLPVLLDLQVFLEAHGAGFPRLRSFERPEPRFGPYDRWLRDYAAEAARRLGLSQRRSRPQRGDWDLPAMLAPDFPAPELSTATLAAFQRLADGVGIEAAVRAWSGPRSARHWERWLGHLLEEVRITAAHVIPSRFAAATSPQWLDETLDHEAARIFLEAADCHPRPDQTRRLWRLKRRRPLHEPNPHPDAYVELDPHFGKVTLGTLASGEYGEFKILNRADQPISSPPPVRPPRKIDVHLVWAHGYASIERDTPAPRFVDTGPWTANVVVAEASVLQGFAALLFDDWRAALRGIHATMYAHCGHPDPARDAFGNPGSRWKAREPRHAAPPAAAAVRFFTRADWVTTAERGLGWTHAAASDAWWCAILLRRELASFGFSPETKPLPGGERTAGLSAPTGALPACIATVLALDPSTRDGILYDVHRTKGAGPLRLWPKQSRVVCDGSFLSFDSIRSRALDALLDAIEART